MSVIDKKVIAFLKDEERVAQYQEGLELIRRSGIIDLLTRIGIPNFVKGGSDTAALAAQAAYSSGYQSCLEHLIDFVDRFTEALDVKQLKQMAADFGGDAAAIEAGFLNKDDLV